MSTRSNEDRLGPGAHNLEHPETPPVDMVNTAIPESPPPTLSFVVPTEFVELPSRGKYYSPNHPLHDKDTIEIRHMTTKEEDILTSRALLKKGVAIDRMLQNLIVDKSIKIKDLLVGDKNALVVSARISGYGPEYVTKIICPSCADAQEYSFDLRTLETNDGSGVFEKWDVTLTENGTFLVLLPRTQVTVELKLMTGIEESRLMETNKKRKKHNLPETPSTDHFRMIIVSVNGDSSAAIINKFIEYLPAIDSRYLRKVYQDTMPSVMTEHEFTCTGCGYDDGLEVPFDVQFFWPK